MQPLSRSLLLHLALALAAASWFWITRQVEVMDAMTYVELRSMVANPNSMPVAKPKTEKQVKLNPDAPPKSANEAVQAAPASAASNAISDSNNDTPRASFEVASLPVLLRESRVPYPPEAKAKGVAGDVQAELIVSREGKVIQVKIVQSPDPILTAAAEAALKTFEFKPANLDGKPVSVKIRYRYRFVLEN
jgi:TonB family protein